MNLDKNEIRLTIVLYVDDILVLWYKIEDLEWLVGKLRSRFTSLTVETLDGFTYLGIYLEIDRKGRYSIGMEDYIVNTCEAHMQDSDNKCVFEKGFKVPAGKDLREVLEGSALLVTKQQKQFHSTTARLLYLTNQVKSTCKVAC